jgi:hypothetical protein
MGAGPISSNPESGSKGPYGLYSSVQVFAYWYWCWATQGARDPLYRVVVSGSQWLPILRSTNTRGSHFVEIGGLAYLDGEGPGGIGAS